VLQNNTTNAMARFTLLFACGSFVLHFRARERENEER
jgi:hypothetical protein